MRIRLTALATRDLDAAYRHYAAIEESLGERFLNDIDAALERLQTFPRGAPPVHGFDGVRRARLRRFPYGIFYRQEDGLLILRVLHTRQGQLRTPANGLS